MVSAIALFAGVTITATISIQRAELAFMLVIIWVFVTIPRRQNSLAIIAVIPGGLALSPYLLSVVHN